MKLSTERKIRYLFLIGIILVLVSQFTFGKVSYYDTNIVSGYHFNNLSDVKGINPFTLSGNVSLSNDKNNVSNSAYNFTGGYLYTATTGWLNTSADFTISFWLRTINANVNKGLVYNGNLASSLGDMALTYDSAPTNQLGMYTGVNALYYGSYSPDTNYQHIVIKRESGTNYIYVNKIPVISGAKAGSNGNNPMYVGCYYSSAFCMNGQIDEIIFINKSLSSTEINETYLDYDTWDYTAPIVDRIAFVNQQPSDLTAISLFNYPYMNITYTYNSTQLNLTTVELLQGISSNNLSCMQYVNGSCLMYNTTYYSIAPSYNNTVGNLINYTYQLSENNVYSYISNRFGSLFNNNVHANYTSNNVNNLIAIRFTNVSNNTRFNLFEVMATSTGVSKVYACNSTYGFTSVVSTNINCQEIGNINSIGYQHVHNANSSHNIVPYSIINYTLSGGVKVTPTMYFIIAGQNGAVTSVSYVNNFTDVDVTKTATGGGLTWTNQTYTVDSHLHVYTGEEYLRYLARAEYNDILNYTVVRTDLIDLTGLNPQPPIILNPLNTTQAIQYMNITYLNATVTVSGASILYYNITLLNSDLTLNLTIRGNNSLNNSYIWDVYNANLSTGTYFIKVRVNDSFGYSSYDVEEFNLTRNALLNVTAYDSVTNISIGNITLNLTNYNTSIVERLNTSTYNLGVNIIRGNNYNLLFDTINYAYTSRNYTANQSSIQLLNQSLYKENSINFYFYDEVSGALLINTTCNLTLAGSFTSSNHNTTTGNIFLSNLTADVYTATGICTLYNQRQYFITVSNRSTQTLNIYLTQGATTVLFSFTDKDTGIVLENVGVALSKMINGTLTLVESRLTDVTGRTQFTVQTNTLYTFTNTKTGYITKTFTLNPVIFTSYNVQLEKENLVTIPLDYTNIDITFTPNIYVIDNNNFTLTISSTTGSLQTYGYNLSSTCNTSTSSGANAYGSTFTTNYLLNSTCINNYESIKLFYYYTDVDGVYRNFTQYFGISMLGQNNSNNLATTLNDKTYGMGLFERTLITTIITLILMGVVGMVGGMLSSLAVGLLVLGYFASSGFIPIYVILITLFVGFLMLATLGKNR